MLPMLIAKAPGVPSEWLIHPRRQQRDDPAPHSVQPGLTRRIHHGLITGSRQVDHQNVRTEHHQTPGPTIIARVAVLETVDAANRQSAVVAPEAEALNGYGIVKQKQAFGLTRRARLGDRNLARLEAIKPQPGENRQEQ